MNENYLRWLAGFFDGEGHVCLLLADSISRKVPTFFLRVGLTQKDPGPLLEVKEVFGGYLCKRVRAYEWSLSSMAAAKFLEAILPYLRLKRHVARLALFYRTIVDMGLTRNGPKKMPEWVRLVLAQLQAEIERLNRLT